MLTFFVLAFGITWAVWAPWGSVLLATLFHATANLFVVSLVVAEARGVALLLLAALASWVLVVVVLAVSSPGLAKSPRPEALPKAYQAAKPLFTQPRNGDFLRGS